MNARQDAILSVQNGVYDISINSEGDIATADFFDTALEMSIHCERRATASEVPQSHRRRGWIGNESTPGFEIGSKMWLYQQSRLTRTTLNGIETAVRNGLQWLVDDGYAVNVEPSVNLKDGVVTLIIKIFRTSSPVELRQFKLWDNTGVV